MNDEALNMSIRKFLKTVGVNSQLAIEWNDIPVLLSIYPPLAERQQPKAHHGGQGRRRARAEAVIDLLRESGS